MLQTPFGITVNGHPVDDYVFLPSPATISYDLKFEEQEARVAAGLGMDEYNRLPGTPMWAHGNDLSKCHIIVWYRYSRRIQAIPQDIQTRKMMMRNRGR